MKAEKSLSSRLSRRNISVAGSAAHSVMAFILTVCACSSVSRAASNGPRDVVVHVPAHGFELLEEFGIEHRRARCDAAECSRSLPKRARRSDRARRSAVGRSATGGSGLRDRPRGPGKMNERRISTASGTPPPEAASERFDVPETRPDSPSKPRGCARAGTPNRFSSRSRPALPAEILGGFSSSLLPPSFPRGRSATFFFAPRAPPPGGRPGPTGAAGDEADRRRRLGHRRARGRARPDAATPGSRLFEAAEHFGGHTHTVDVTLGGRTHGVDTGFLVFNERTYPTAAPPCSPSSAWTRRPPTCRSRPRSRAARHRMEQRGRRRRVRAARQPAAPGVLEHARRDRRASTASPPRWRVAAHERSPRTTRSATSSTRIASRRASATGTSCRWSAASGRARPSRCCASRPPTMVALLPRPRPAAGQLRRPQWYTVRGGADATSASMLAAIADARLGDAGAARQAAADRRRRGLDRPQARERFDAVVLACHSDQALALLADPSADEREVLGAFRYQRNGRPAHRHRVLPVREAAWAAWNYERRMTQRGDDGGASACTYLVNRLQPLPFETPVIVSLNPMHEPAAAIGAGRVPLRPSGLRPARDRRPGAAARPAGPRRQLVLRRLDRPRLPRGRTLGLGPRQVLRGARCEAA